MKLEEKGRIIPAPTLRTNLELVSQQIQKWPGIISATHWEIWDRNQPDGADFYVGESELGHIHLDGGVHIFSTKKISTLLIEKGLANRFPYGENWVQYHISGKKTVEHSIWLFKLHHDHLVGKEESELLETISTYNKQT
ncbi:MAG: luciferase family protein [Chitinophagaceae bacterium]